MCEDSGWLSNATKTAAHWSITALAICFHQDKCQSPAAEHRGSKCRWPSWKPICFVVCSAVRCDQESPAGCRGSRSRDPVGDLLQGWSELCLPHTYRVFLFISGSQAKHHPQPLPQCPPSLKQSNRWLDPDVPYPARFAVVFCFLVMRGHGLEVIPAAPVTPLLRGCFHLCGCCICGIPNMTRKDPCWLLVVSVSLPVGTQARICMYFWSSDCGGTCKMIFSAFSFECRLPRLITVMKNSVHPVWNYICLFRPLLELMLLLLMHDFCFHVSYILLWSSPVAPDIPLKTTSPQTVIWL